MDAHKDEEEFQEMVINRDEGDRDLCEYLESNDDDAPDNNTDIFRAYVEAIVDAKCEDERGE